MSHKVKEFTIHDLSNLMKTSSLRSFAHSAALRFKFFPSASRAVGDMWADRAGQPYRICNGGRDAHAPLCSAKLLRALRASAFRFIRHSKSNIQNSSYLCVLGVLAFHSFAAASTTWNGPTWTVSTVIPDNDEVGFTDTRNITVPAITEIESLTVNLNFTGGWNGDLYAYLVHGSGFSVLLNRPGRNLGNPDGSATVGMDITFDDSAFSDIHTAIPMSGGEVTGTWQPDGRETDPLLVLNTDARTAMLADFSGLDPNGTWTLFVADQSPGETSTLQSWSMTITAVPEPSVAVLIMFPAAAFLVRRRRMAR
jgi:subtilisin-like proprotein convertase family protein